MPFNPLHEFFIWWTGVDRETFDSHELRRLKKPYAGLGALALLSTVLAVVGAYSFIWSSLRSRPSALLAALFAGLFMWAFDRSILGYISPNPAKTRVANVVKLIVNVSFSTMLAIPLATDVLNGGIAADKIEEIQERIGIVEEKIEKKQGELNEAIESLREIDGRSAEADRSDGSPNLSYRRTKTLAQELVEQFKLEANDLRSEREDLRTRQDDYKNSDYNYYDPEFSFPEKLNRVLSRGSEIGAGEKIIAVVTFLLSAIVGSGAVVARTIFIGDDSYAIKWRGKESIACKSERAAYKTEELEILASEVPSLSDDFMDEIDSSDKRFEDEMLEMRRENQRRTLERLKKKHKTGHETERYGESARRKKAQRISI